MAIYKYSRVLVNGIYNVNNEERKDGMLQPINLAKEVEILIPGEKFVMRCDNENVDFIFYKSLIGADQTKLNDGVSTHKSNT